MENECSIVRDLLPLYAENMVSTETAAFVEGHLEGCEACREENEQMKQPQPPREKDGAVPLLKLKKKMAAKKAQTIALTAIFVITLLVSAFAVLDAPVYFPYSEELVAAEQIGSKSLLIVFGEEVTDFDYTVYPDPNGGTFYYCEIQAWTSLWDKLFSKGEENLTAVVITEEEWLITALYVPNDSSESVCIYGNMVGEHSIVLPRLSLVFYLALAAGALLVAAIVWLFTRKKAGVRVWVERLGLYPVSYIISHFIVSGGGLASYSLQRDFCLIIFISILLYSGLLLAHSIWRLKKEIKEINQ